jgi:hypothetical protein
MPASPDTAIVHVDAARIDAASTEHVQPVSIERHQGRAPAGVLLCVVVNASLIPGETAIDRGGVVRAEIQSVGLDAEAVARVVEIEHLASLISKILIATHGNVTVEIASPATGIGVVAKDRGAAACCAPGHTKTIAGILTIHRTGASAARISLNAIASAVDRQAG